jgi:succinoglycan biosynthesis transport protein ExoP
MGVRDYIEILWRRKWIIVIAVAVTMVMATAATFLATPMYRASTILRVLAVTGGGSSDWVTYDSRQIERLMNTYAELATSRLVYEQLARELEIIEVPEIQVDIRGETELIAITAEGPDPVVARDAANALAELLIDETRALYTGSGKTAQEILGEQLARAKTELDEAWTEYETLLADSPEDSDTIAAAGTIIDLKERTYAVLLEQYERNRVREAVLANTLSVVEPAIAPSAPSSPRRGLNLALGLVVGLVAGVALAFLFENLDTTLYSAEQIKGVTGLPLLGTVPTAGRRKDEGLFNGNSPEGEAFRHLRTQVLMHDHGSSVQTLLVTSAGPQEGKSTVVANLASAMAQTGRTVMVVDAHLRLPTVHKMFGLSNKVGLSSVLEGKASLEEAVQTAEIPGVHVLASGPVPANPAELISSAKMKELVAELADQYDMILLDTPSLLAVTDAAELTRAADGVVLVVERAQARQESVWAACQQLASMEANPIGVVVNRVSQDGFYLYYQHVPT